MKCAVNLRKQIRIAEFNKRIEEGQNLVKKETMNQTVNYMLVAFATYLGDKRGWKPERICKALAWIEKFTIMIYEDYTTFEEAKEALREDYGLIFTDKGVMIEEARK